MKKLIAALFMLSVACCNPAQAETRVLRDAKGDTLILSTAKCINPEVLQHIPPIVHEAFYVGVAQLRGAIHEACWAMTDGGQKVLIVFKNGRNATLPAYVFTQGDEV